MTPLFLPLLTKDQPLAVDGKEIRKLGDDSEPFGLISCYV